MIVVVANEKGGSGKTTIATNLAVLRAQDGNDVILVDSDPQGSSTDFAKVRDAEGHQPEISCVSIVGANLASEIRKLEPKFDDMVIDVGGRDTVGLRASLLVADIVIIPCLPSQYDIWVLEKLDEVIGTAKALNEKLRAIAFFNKVDTNPKMSLIDEALSVSTDLKNIQITDSKIFYRVAYRRSVADGQSVTELLKKDSKANSEIKSLYEEVFNYA